MSENTKKNIENLINNIDEFNAKYITYRTSILRTILIEALDYIKLKEQAFDEIERYRIAEINDEDEEENDTISTIINEVKNN